METGALQALLNQNQSQHIKASSLRPGQIVNGQIMKLYPEQIAEVQIGNQKMVAQLEAPLSAYERYWFQVQPGEGKIHLKVIAPDGDDDKRPEGLSNILRQFSVPPTKDNMELIRFFVKEQLPISRETLLLVSGWLKDANPRSAGMEAVKLMLNRGLPLTPATYSALYTASKEHSLVHLMIQLQKILYDVPQTESTIKVKTLLDELMSWNKSHESGLHMGSNDAAEFISSAKIKGFLSALGLSYEHQIAEALSKGHNGKIISADILKPHLLRLLTEQPPSTVKEAAEQLLNKITGLQILSQESGPIQQIVLQMPFTIGGKTNEVTMQWSGKRTENGNIDADFCRVLFYLKLEHIDDTIIDMQVQNRILSIQVMNENPSLKKLAAELLPLLRGKLAEADYHLSSINFIAPDPAQPSGKNNKLNDRVYSNKEYTRVDIKI
jgi:hypothetical protein